MELHPIGGRVPGDVCIRDEWWEALAEGTGSRVFRFLKIWMAPDYTTILVTNYYTEESTQNLVLKKTDGGGPVHSRLEGRVHYEKGKDDPA